MKQKENRLSGWPGQLAPTAQSPARASASAQMSCPALSPWRGTVACNGPACRALLRPQVLTASDPAHSCDLRASANFTPQKR